MIIAPEVNPEPIPGVRLQPQADATAFGGGPGLAQENQETQKIAAEAGEIAGFERIRADQTAVQEATAKLSAIHTDLLTNPQTGLPAYRGVNAMSGQTTLWNQYQKSANEIAETLHGQAQQGAFTKTAIGMGDAFLQNVRAHVSKELDAHDAQTFEVLVNNKADESGKTYGNSAALAFNYKIVDDAAQARAQRLGLDDQETQKFMRAVKTTYHEDVLGQMVNDPNFLGRAKQYFYKYKDEMDNESQDRVRQLFDVVPKQQEAAAKSQQEQYYKASMRTAMLDMFDGKMTLSEAQRLYRENKLDKSDYDVLESRLNKPDAGAMRSFMVSDPATFNNIRQAQLTGSASPGEIQRMIAKGAASKDIAPDDGKYLMGVNSETPPTARDKYVESQANNLRDFGNRYFAETNFLGMATNKEKTSQEAEQLVSDFYSEVDKKKAKGEDIDAIRDHILKTYAQKRYPGLGNLEKMPDVVIDTKGKVTRLLNPDQHSGLKPRYKITLSGAGDKEEQ